MSPSTTHPTNMRVQKRNGEYQPLDLNKIHAVLEWACNGDANLPRIRGVSVSDIELNAKLHLHDKMKTSDIHKLLVTSAADLISEDYPNYDQVAARLVWFAVRKEAFGENQPPHLSEVIRKNIERGFYDPAFLDYYTDEEIAVLNSMIDHTRDDLFKYAGAVQMRGKYLTQNRKLKKPSESFQFPYIMVAATLFSQYPKDRRMTFVKAYYDHISTHDLSEPTPVMAGVRTRVKQYSSCVVVSAGDTLDSIERAGAAIMRYASRKAGLGIDGGRIRGEGQPIRAGEAVSTGQIPFLKKFNGDLKSTSQGGVRGASATYNYPFWHIEFPAMIELKNEKGTEETRCRTMDYCVHFNLVVFERWIARQNVTLFSPEEVPGLYELFYSRDINGFRDLYEKYERAHGIKKITIPAKDLVEKFLSERFETTRYYFLFADRVNMQSPFYEPITSTNLCVEIALVTRPVSAAYPLGIIDVQLGDQVVSIPGHERVKKRDGTVTEMAFIDVGDDVMLPFGSEFFRVGKKEYTREPGAIALCTLGAVNVGKIDITSEAGRIKAAKMLEVAVRAKDALLDYQDYPLLESKLAVLEYRPLGFGYIGFAHWLAKNRLRWGTPETIERVNELAEFVSFHLIKASIQLAKEFGPCKKRTRYHDGWMPFDDSPLSFKKTLPWDELREAAKTYGIRNATLMAFMPSETSSQLANETNGVEPPKSLVTLKGSTGEGSPAQVVPEIQKLGMYYELAWDVKCSDYLQTLAPIQHYADQSISVNTTYDPRKLPKSPEGKVKLSTFASDFVLAYKLGLKTGYYLNVNDRDDETVEDDGCGGGACKI